jgi:hypothetical protein
MTAKERTLWEQAVRVLQQNSVTATLAIDTPRGERVLARTRSGKLRKEGTLEISR